MLSHSICKKRQLAMHQGAEGRTQGSYQQHRSSSHPLCGLLLLIIFSSWAISCQGAPFTSHTLRAEQELQLWNEIDDVCTAILSDSQPMAPSALEELCFMAMGILQRSQGSEEKDNTKRNFNLFSAQFLFHYSKSHDSGNSDIMSSVLHPLLQLVPQLHDRRMKRFKADEEVQGPGGVLSRGYFLFRPRNGRRSAGFR
ncbi:neuromedin-U [Pelodytes ibericus]